MKFKPFTRGVLRLWVVLTVILFVYTYIKGEQSREAWPRIWSQDYVVPAKISLLNPACQPVILNPEQTEGISDDGCKRLGTVLGTSDTLKAITAKGKKVTPQDIQADYDEQYNWYSVKGGLIEAGMSVIASAVLLCLFLLLVKVGKWVIAGFRKESP